MSHSEWVKTGMMDDVGRWYLPGSSHNGWGVGREPGWCQGSYWYPLELIHSVWGKRKAIVVGIGDGIFQKWATVDVGGGTKIGFI